MNLSLTPLSDAWSEPNREPLKKVLSRNEPSVDAYNSSVSYDEYVINIDSFKPFRIDVSIKNQQLVDRLKCMSTDEQVNLVTKLLIEYFENTPSERSEDIQPVIVKGQSAPPVPKVEMISPNSTPNSTRFMVHDPAMHHQIEYMKPPGVNDCNNTSLLIVLVFAIWMLLDRLMHIM